MKEKESSEETTEMAGFHKDEKGTIVVTDTNLFGEHLEKVNKRLEEKQQAEEPSPDDLRVAGVAMAPIHLACDDDDKISPNHRLVEIKNNIASATNGTILVKIDLSLTTNLTKAMLKVLDGKYIHMSVWNEIHKCDWLQVDDDMITCHKADIVKMFEYSNPQGTFFSMNQVIQNIQLAGEEKKRIICYNTKLIATLTKIFSTENLHFSFSKGNQGTFVFPYYDCGMFAVLMPVEMDKTENRYSFT